MSASTDQLRQWAAEDRAAAAALPESLPEQTAAIRWMAAAGEQNAAAGAANDRADALEGAKSALEISADGFDTIADAADAKEAAGG